MPAKAVIAYAIGLPAYVLVKALAPNFFARGDTKTPVKYSIPTEEKHSIFIAYKIPPLMTCTRALNLPNFSMEFSVSKR